MKASTVVLRERVVAVERGMPRAAVADEQVQVSLGTIKRWLRRQQTTGHLAPSPRPGPPSVKMATRRTPLLPQLQERNDAPLAEHCRLFAERHGIQVSPATRSRVITRHFGWTLKKVRH